MPKDFSRSERIADQMQRDLSTLIRDEVKDPRVHLVTVSAVEVSRDLSHAKVFVSSLSEQTDPKVLVKVLDKAAGFLRRQLGQMMKLRQVPQLKFVHDDSFDRELHISSLIDTALGKHSS